MVFQTGIGYSSFNIQYQSTGVGSLPSLDEIELTRYTIFIYKHLQHFLVDVFKNNIILEILIKVRSAVTSKIMVNN